METCAHLQWNYLSWRLSVWCDLHKEYDGQGGAPPSPPPAHISISHVATSHPTGCSKKTSWAPKWRFIPQNIPKKKQSTWPMPTSAISLRYPNFEPPPKKTGLLKKKKILYNPDPRKVPPAPRPSCCMPNAPAFWGNVAEHKTVLVTPWLP